MSKGPGVFTGYFKSLKDRSEIFTEDGFFRTGDQAKKDEFGNIWITGRIKDIINRGGENISAVEIESLMSDHPKIIDSAGIDVILVGDSASNVMAGNETTLPITLDHMIYHATSVVKAVERALIVVDIPFGTVPCSRSYPDHPDYAPG